MGKKKSRYQSEIEVPPHTKVLLHVTIERTVNAEMQRIHDDEIQIAIREDRTVPDWSNTTEMICRKCIKTYRQERRQTA